VKVRATLPNSKGDLKAGMFMDVAVLSKTHNSLSIPEIAVVAEGEETFAFVVEKGQRPPGAGGPPGGGPPQGAPQAAPQQQAEAKPPQAAPGAPGTSNAGGPPGAPGGERPFLVAHKKPIKIGVREKGVVEVLSGLNEGDKVVTDGILKVRPNAPVRIKMPPKDGGGGEGGGEGGPRVAGSDTPVDKSSLRQ
jgi:membrane fusion protein (multidrug efflux system)